MCIFLYLYFEIKRLPRYPHLSPLQHEIEPPLSSFLLFFFIGRSLPENGILFIEIFFLGSATFILQLAAAHLLRIFKGKFFTIKKDKTKSLGLRGKEFLKLRHGERRLMRMVEQNGCKFRRLEKIIKKKKRFWWESKQNFRETSLLYV